MIWGQNFFGWLIRGIFKLLWIKIKYISEDEILWRAVFNRAQIKDDGTLKSSFFRDRNGLSCDIARFTTEENACKPRGEESLWIKSPGLVILTLRLVRLVYEKSDIDVCHSPDKNYNNYAHCMFTKELNRTQARMLTKNPTFQRKPIY